jgi:predicted NUDIX family NTP pyrophosphohydrolase
MAKLSAGILLYKHEDDKVKVMLVHPGGPFWAKKDDGAWSIPKGEIDADEDMLDAARREFAEEIGSEVPKGELVELGEVKTASGKVIHVWAMEHDFDVTTLKSNSFEMAWPPKSGQKQTFPEVDKAAWFGIAEAPVKMHTGQAVFIERLAEKLSVSMTPAETTEPAGGGQTEPGQISLF